MGVVAPGEKKSTDDNWEKRKSHLLTSSTRPEPGTIWIWSVNH